MRRKTTHFLTASFVLASIFCMIVFVVQTMWMNQMGAGAIKEIGVIYMSGMSKQIAAHFGTTIELRLSQVESLVDAVSPARKRDYSAMRLELAYYARSKGFEYLAFYTDEGDFQIIYGPKVVPEVPQALHRSVMGGKDNVSAGQDEHGERVVLIGVPAAYDIGEGRKSAALVAGLPADYLDDALAVNVDSSMVDYSIIRTDGTVIMQNADVAKSNYFDKADWEDEYVSRLRESMENGEDYSGEIKADGKRWNLYCTALPASEWHLLLHMPYSTLDRTVERLANRWSFCSVSGCMLVLGALLLVFAGYYRLTRKQMYELNKAYQSAEKERHTAERASRAKSEFLSNMSHDIRTPMNAIVGFSTLLQRDAHDPDRVYEYTRKISSSSQHLLGLINDVLDMSKIESGKTTLNISEISLAEVVDELGAMMQVQAKAKHQDFRIYVYDVCNEEILGDRLRINQILINILSNAVKYTPDGGKIEMSVRQLPQHTKNYARFRFVIKDNGIGMSEEYLETIFQPFSRESSKKTAGIQGTGLGMAITKNLIDLMGGTISVESELDHGSTFTLVLELRIKEQNVDPEFWIKHGVTHLLVVDDEEEICLGVQKTMTGTGVNIQYALGGQEAVAMAEGAEADGRGFDLVIIDWQMPDISGIETARRIRKIVPSNVPIMILTAYDISSIEEEGTKAGVDGFLQKPFFLSNFKMIVDSMKGTGEEAQSKFGPDDEEITLEGMHILAAEDIELNAEILMELLKIAGATCEWAGNGQEALEMFEQSEPGHYDLILMDVQMPVMNGYDATRAIRGCSHPQAETVPIIAMTANTFSEDVKDALDAGMNAHVGKPVDMNLLKAVIKGVTGSD